MVLDLIKKLLQHFFFNNGDGLVNEHSVVQHNGLVRLLYGWLVPLCERVVHDEQQHWSHCDHQRYILLCVYGLSTTTKKIMRNFPILCPQTKLFCHTYHQHQPMSMNRGQHLLDVFHVEILNHQSNDLGHHKRSCIVGLGRSHRRGGGQLWHTLELHVQLQRERERKTNKQTIIIFQQNSLKEWSWNLNYLQPGAYANGAAA